MDIAIVFAYIFEAVIICLLSYQLYKLISGFISMMHLDKEGAGQKKKYL